MILNSRWIQFQQFFHKLLILAILALVVYSASILMKPTEDINMLVKNLKSQSQSKSIKAYQVKDVPPFRFYEDAINARNPFEDIAVDKALQEKIVPISKNDKLPAHLKIVGIVQGNPSEVILEDSKKNTSWFLTEGKAQESFLLERVNNDQIIIKIDNELLTITLD